jgi:hypothetical protein
MMGSSGRVSLLVMMAMGAFPLAASAADVTAARAALPPAPRKSLPRLGIMADAGLPDGVTASLVYRPRRWVRAHVGGGYNMISPGVRAGATLAPFGWGPSLTLEAGHYFDGNANRVARKLAGSSFNDSALLERVGYDFANAHLGFEVGYRRMTFYLHAGMSYMHASLHNAQTLLQSEAGGSSLVSSNSEVTVARDPVLRAFVPSAKLGLIVYVW